MHRQAFPLLLLFLLVSAIADDLVVSFTPGPPGDILAAANNTYLSARPTDHGLREPGGALPESASLDTAAAALPAGAPRLAWTAGLAAGPQTGTDLLYCLMALRP